MKIEVKTTRDCCAREDLRPVEGAPKAGRDSTMMFCVHCGRRHRMYTFTDAAGSRDWEYRREPDPWEPGGRSDAASWMLCEHANEVPSVCTCPDSCPCKTTHCKGRRSA
jgi:hypothetical protein